MDTYPRIIWRLSPLLRSTSSIALTFDDGPHPTITPQLLDLFDQYGVRATFFLVGDRVARWPELAERIAAAGHAIGSHGWAHRRDWWRGTSSLGDDLDRAEVVLDRYLGVPKLFRPPYGALSPTWYRAARKRGYTIALWNTTVRDWTISDPARIEHALHRKATPGRIVLLHECRATNGEGYSHTVEAINRYLQYATSRNFRFISLREAFAQRDAFAESVLESPIDDSSERITGEKRPCATQND
jgi:peptidoglycan/xylan/chitin deacetylase (PgdA/CDA1 family)